MNTFVSHPSVRIKGTENHYDPVHCIDPLCDNKTAHMHCPFCVKSEYYQDPVILKAHYRVKHVDKGIEFAGLKVLRCCDHCDIVGSIKGTKEIKGAHWHCYKCRNGFNRRDEAFKHYRTHFRNPQTTFQIQVAQEVNQMSSLTNEAGQASDTISQQDVGNIQVHTLTDGVIGEMQLITQADMPTPLLTTTTMTNGKTGESGELQVSVAANETVGTSAGGEPQTIMIIQEDQLEECGSVNSSLEDNDRHIEMTDSDVLAHSKHSNSVEIQHLQIRNQQLEMQKAEIEKRLTGEIEELKLQLKVQSDRIASHQKREQELLSQLSIPVDERTNDILATLKEQHEELLLHQLSQLKQLYLQGLNATQYSTDVPTSSPLQFDTEVVTLAVSSDSATNPTMSMMVNSEEQVLMSSEGVAGNVQAISEGQHIISQPVMEGTGLASSQLMLQAVTVVDNNSSNDLTTTEGMNTHVVEDGEVAHLGLVKSEPNYEQTTDSLSSTNEIHFRLVETFVPKKNNMEETNDESVPAKRQKLANS